MRKSTRLIKRFAALFLVVLMSIESFGAVVTDNDGSAFITKAEFDSAKTDFQSQLNQFNSSIDMKIDNAIVSYLAGVIVNRDSINYYDLFVKGSGKVPTFIQSISAGTNSVNATTLNGTVHVYGKVCNNMFCYEGYGGEVNDTQLHIGGNYGQGGWKRAMVWYSWVPINSSGAWVAVEDQSSKDLVRNTGYNSTSYPPTYAYKTWDTVITQKTNGSGSRWLSQRFGDFNCLKFFCTNFYVDNKIYFDSYYYFYKQINETDKAAYLSNNGKAVTGITLPTYTITPKPGQIVTAGHAMVPANESSDARIQYRSSLSKVTDGYNYLDAFWSLTSDIDLYAYDENYQGEVSTTKETYTVNAGTFDDVFYKANGLNRQTNNYPQYKFYFYPIILKNSSTKTKLSKFCNRTSSTIIGEAVHHGAGMPIAKTLDDNKRISIKIKLKSKNNVNCNVKIASAPFNFGNCASDKLLTEDIIRANASDYKTFTVDVSKAGMVWLWLKNQSDSFDVEISGLEIKDIR